MENFFQIIEHHRFISFLLFLALCNIIDNLFELINNFINRK